MPTYKVVLHIETEIEAACESDAAEDFIDFHNLDDSDEIRSLMSVKEKL